MRNLRRQTNLLIATRRPPLVSKLIESAYGIAVEWSPTRKYTPLGREVGIPDKCLLERSRRLVNATIVDKVVRFPHTGDLLDDETTAFKSAPEVLDSVLRTKQREQSIQLPTVRVVLLIGEPENLGT